MHKTTDLMELGKLTLQLEQWSWGNAALGSERSSSGVSGQRVLQFTHEEVQQDSYYSNDIVDTEISVEEARELVHHLQKFIDESGGRL